MRYWIFQGNPKVFDLTRYLADHDQMNWAVRQAHLAPKMVIGDEVYFWRAASDDGESGVVAVGTINSKPFVRGEDKINLRYWKTPDGAKPFLRVGVAITRRCLGAKDIVKRKWIVDDPILRNLRIVRFANQTNYEITASEAQRLALLARNTGNDWNRDECVAALWAFDQTEGKKVSKLADSPVAQVAVTIGRAVGGVYNKVMNFRAIDPRDTRAGLSATNEIDREVWREFYDPASQSLKRAELQTEFRRLWANSAIRQERKAHYREFGEAPNDDAFELQQFARRVRRGQPKFRKKLLQLYGNQCAITGWAPAEVLDAAHISEHSKSGINHSANGILLRSDLHALLDANLLRINPKTCTIIVDGSLAKTPYWSLNGSKLRERLDGSQIAIEYLSLRFAR